MAETKWWCKDLQEEVPIKDLGTRQLANSIGWITQEVDQINDNIEDINRGITNLKKKIEWYHRVQDDMKEIIRRRTES